MKSNGNIVFIGCILYYIILYIKVQNACKDTTKFADLQILCRKSFERYKSKVFSCGRKGTPKIKIFRGPRNRKAKQLAGLFEKYPNVYLGK